jgi:hypothetical protein
MLKNFNLQGDIDLQHFAPSQLEQKISISHQKYSLQTIQNASLVPSSKSFEIEALQSYVLPKELKHTVYRLEIEETPNLNLAWIRINGFVTAKLASAVLVLFSDRYFAIYLLIRCT